MKKSQKEATYSNLYKKKNLNGLILILKKTESVIPDLPIKKSSNSEHMNIYKHLENKNTKTKMLYKNMCGRGEIAHLII